MNAQRSVREHFVATFSEADADRMVAAAEQHDNDVHNKRGSDPFKWALAICIGYECFTEYRKTHGFTATAADITRWIIDHGDLASHDGDVDFLGLAAGAYNKYVPAAMTETP